jgi:exportin-2 (importin alpha re-exporter)
LEYIRRDMEGSDIDTRRRTTVELIRALTRQFESEVTAMLKKYVAHLLADYATAPATKWIMKDAAMYIILALAVQGKTQGKGVTKTNQYVDIMEFFGGHVVPELKSDPIDERPVLRADCIKFVTEFRYQIPVDGYTILLPMLIRYLSSEHFVVT